MNKLDIFNSALAEVGAETISSPTENNKRAKLCVQHYETIRKKAIRSHPWNFATKRASGVPNGVIPPFGFEQSYTLPSDFLRLLKLDIDDIEHQVEGGVLLCNEATLDYVYIADVDEELYDVHFGESLALELASKIAYSMTQDFNLVQSIQGKAFVALKDARSFNAQEGTPQDFIADSFLKVRY